MAHHVLGHTSVAATSLDESRDRETKADEWAVEHLLAAGIMPAGGVYSLLLFYFIDQDALAYERTRQHPAEERRFKMFISATLDALPQFKDRFRAMGVSESDVKTSLESAVSQLEIAVDRTQ